MSDFYLNPECDNESVIRNIGSTIRSLDKTKRWQISCKVFRKNRSKAQNAFYWSAFLPAIVSWYYDSRGVKVSAEGLHDELKKIYVPFTESIRTTGEQYKLYKSTTNLTTTEFNTMLDEMAADFSDMGCATPLPDPDFKKRKKKEI